MSETNGIKKLEYPKELVSIVRDQTFALTNELSRPNAYDPESPESPLKFYSKFSRFVASIINGNRKATIANIPIKDIADILKRSDFIYNKEMEQSQTINEKTDLSPAYTVKMTAGKLKGKTPAEILLESTDNKKVLNQQYTWLKENLKKYPANQEQMDAIVDAANLLEKNELDPGKVKASISSFSVYNPGLRPLSSRPKQNGKEFVYQITITWFVGDNYPVNVDIMNCYAPVTEDENKLKNVHMSQNEDRVVNSMKFTAAEWMNVLACIDRNMKTFEMLSASACYRDSANIDKKNREEAKKAKDAAVSNTAGTNAN